jgi:hypothetical protein
MAKERKYRDIQHIEKFNVDVEPNNIFPGIRAREERELDYAGNRKIHQRKHRKKRRVSESPHRADQGKRVDYYDVDDK